MANQRLRDIPSLNGDAKNLSAVVESIREALQMFRGFRGDPLDRALTLRDLDIATQRAVAGGGTFGGGSTTVIVDGSGGGSGGGTTPDPTPPPTATGLAVTAGLSYLYISTDAPVYTQGHGHGKTRVFGAKWPESDPTPPTFSEAVQIVEYEGTIGAYPTDTGTRWCIWVKWVSVDGYESVSPAGGTNGVQATTGKIGNTDLGPLIVTAENISQGLYPGINLVPNPGAEDGTVAWGITQGGLTASAFTSDTSDKVSGSRSFRITKPLATDNCGVGCRAFPVIPGDTYSVKVRVRTSVASAAGLYIRLQLKATKPSGDIVTFALADVVQQFVNNGASNSTWTAYEFTYTIPAGMYWASFVVMNWGTGSATSMWFDECSVGRQITASFLAADSIAVGTLAVQAGAIVNAMIGDATIDSAKIATLNAIHLTAGDGTIGGRLKSSNYVLGSTGWILNPNGTAQFPAAYILGQLVAAQIDTRGLSIKNSAGTVLFDENTPLTASYIAALIGGGNLLPNSSFELDSDANGIPDAWGSTSLGTGVTATRAIVATALDGTKGLRLTISAFASPSSAIHSVVQDTASASPVQAGAWYKLCTWAQTSTTTYKCEIAITWLDATDTPIGGNVTVASKTLAATGTWERVVGSAAQAPAGAVKARARLGIRRPSVGDTTLGNMTWDCVSFEPGELETAWAPSHRDKTGIDNPITDANIAAYMAAAVIGSAYIKDLAVKNQHVNDLSADKINAGAIRGINVNASSHTTVGSYLTAAAAGGAATVQVKDTTDFPASGTAIVIDTSNDGDSFTYTGKTATALTGCSGVLAHNAGATVIPRTKAMVIDAATNEMRFFADRGDGTIEEVAAIGLLNVAGDIAFARFGSLSPVAGASRVGVYGASHDTDGVYGQSVDGNGVFGQSVDGLGVTGTATGSGIGVSGNALGSNAGVAGASVNGPGVSGDSVNGFGGSFKGNATRSQLFLEPLAGRPTNKSRGSIAYIYTTGGTIDNRTDTPRLFQANGSVWVDVVTGATYSG